MVYGYGSRNPQDVSKCTSVSMVNVSGGSGNNGTWYIGKPYSGKSQPPKLVPGANWSLNLECWYCKGTDHLKENCIKLNHQLAQEQQRLEQNSSAPSVNSTNSGN